MSPTPDENDVVSQPYALDIEGIVRSIYEAFSGGDGEAFMETLAIFWNVFSILAIILSILFFAGFIYAKIRYEQLCALQEEQLRDEEIAWAHTYGGAAKGDSRWGDILSHVAGSNPSEWRVAVIEADILLGEVLERAGYEGVAIGDQLKSAAHSPFSTLQDAWDAHKVRNQIAHAGGDFVLTKKIAQETIARYERVLREFNAI